jgi:protein-disulfide isomerase
MDKRNRSESSKGGSVWNLRTIAVILALLVISAGYIFWPRSSNGAVSTSGLADDPSLGPPDAPVTIIEYGDFGCTNCRYWFNQGVLEKIRSTYGDKVRFVWRDFPVITAESPKAAEAGQCAYDQGKFWEYHDLLYQRAPALSISDLKAYAKELGLNEREFNQCLDSGKHQATVERDLQDAHQRGFSAPPTFLVNNEPILGPASFEVFKNAIDPLLKNAS